MIVVDASVAVKWLWPEPGDAEAATYLASESPLLAPASVRIEVTGAVLRRFQENKMAESEARSACALWDRIIRDRLKLMQVDELYDAAVAFAFMTRHALADCLYLAAAHELNATLLTADRDLHKRGRTAYDKILMLTGLVPH